MVSFLSRCIFLRVHPGHSVSQDSVEKQDQKFEGINRVERKRQKERDREFYGIGLLNYRGQKCENLQGRDAGCRLRSEKSCCCIWGWGLRPEAIWR